MDNDLSHRVIGCAYEVSNTLGAGFSEKVYENSLCLELENQGISFRSQQLLDVRYKGLVVGEYIADIIVDGELILELKAVNAICNEHKAQLMNYLKATGLQCGLLLNFGRPKLDIK